jgi:hypothetical protein
VPSTQNAVSNHKYCKVPVTLLGESATNPRKRFDENSIEEPAYVPRHIPKFCVTGHFVAVHAKPSVWTGGARLERQITGFDLNFPFLIDPVALLSSLKARLSRSRHDIPGPIGSRSDRNRRHPQKVADTATRTNWVPSLGLSRLQILKSATFVKVVDSNHSNRMPLRLIPR